VLGLHTAEQDACLINLGALRTIEGLKTSMVHAPRGIKASRTRKVKGTDAIATGYTLWSGAWGSARRLAACGMPVCKRARGATPSGNH